MARGRWGHRKVPRATFARCPASFRPRPPWVAAGPAHHSGCAVSTVMQRVRIGLSRATRLTRRAVARAALEPVLKREWEEGTAYVTERLIWYAFALRYITERSPQTLLDVGPGPSAWPHVVAMGGVRVTAVDDYSMYGRGPQWWRRTRYFNRHYYVLGDDISRSRLTELFDFVTCLSVLELVDDHRAVVR